MNQYSQSLDFPFFFSKCLYCDFKSSKQEVHFDPKQPQKQKREIKVSLNSLVQIFIRIYQDTKPDPQGQLLRNTIIIRSIVNWIPPPGFFAFCFCLCLFHTSFSLTVSFCFPFLSGVVFLFAAQLSLLPAAHPQSG